MKIPTECIVCKKRAKRTSLQDGINACRLHYKMVKEQKEKEEIVEEVKI
jgi:hypothetical protein